MTRRVLLESGGVFVGFVGFASATMSLLPARQWQWNSSLAVLAAAAASSVAFAVVRARPRQMPDLLPDEGVVGCSIGLTTEPAMVRLVNQLAAGVYPGVEPLDPNQYATWLAINPTILVSLLDRKRQLCGYFDVFPLDDHFLTELMAGRVGEQDIRGEHILPPAQARAAKRLYLAGVAVSDAGTTAGKWHGAMLLSALWSYLRHFYDAPCEKELVAIGATEDGENLLERLQFTVVVPGERRRDGKPCYVRMIDDELFRRLSPVIGNWSQACTIAWEQTSQARLVRRSH